METLPNCSDANCTQPGTLVYTNVSGVWCLRHDPMKLHNPPRKKSKHKPGRWDALPTLEIAPQCVYCGVTLTIATATQDHVIPLSRGGINAPINKAPCCLECNQDKGPLTVAEYLSVKNNKAALKALTREVLRRQGYR